MSIITNEINLFGIAQVEDKCKAQKIYRVRDDPIMTLDEDQNIFLITSVIHSLKNYTNSLKTCYVIYTVFVQRGTWAYTPFLATIRKPLFALRFFDCCVSNVKKYHLGTSKCHDHDILTLHLPIRLQHFERGNEKVLSIAMVTINAKVNYIIRL